MEPHEIRIAQTALEQWVPPAVEFSVNNRVYLQSTHGFGATAIIIQELRNEGPERDLTVE